MFYGDAINNLYNMLHPVSGALYSMQSIDLTLLAYFGRYTVCRYQKNKLMAIPLSVLYSMLTIALKW